MSIKRAFYIIGAVILAFIVVFLGARFGWRLFGFSFCQDTQIEEVKMMDDHVVIKGKSIDENSTLYVGSCTKEKDGKLYLGLKFNSFFGVRSTDHSSYEIDVPLKNQVDAIYIKAGDEEHKIWDRTEKEQSPGKDASQVSGSKPEKEPNQTPVIAEPVQQSIIAPEGKTLESRILTPVGYKRTDAKNDSLSSFLRGYELKEDKADVLLYDGSKKKNQEAHVAVFKLPIENRNLQQCADSIMRVYAEYYWSQKQYEKIAFHFSNGFMADYKKWQNGYRINVDGNDVSWVKSESFDDSYETFQKYLRIVFCYAGTMSMERESKPTTLDELQVGEVFIRGGSPGHVVMVVDTCENSKGEKAFLLAQGFMPAQEFHVLKNENHEDDPWYYENEVTYPFETPEYTFEEGSLRQLEY